jgi:putative endonuclease
MFHTYILRCSDNTLYIGCTNDLEKRLHQHNQAKAGAHYTKIRRPVTLVHKESFRTLAKARVREAELKRLTRGQKLAIIAE